jgi:hypothetical protein
MANTIDDLRNHLFETLAALKDKDAPMELDRARTVADVARVLVDSAKVEVEFLKVTQAVKSTDFLPVTYRPSIAERIASVPGPGPAPPVGERCVLCGCKLTTAYLIERGLCGTCSDRPEAKPLKAAGARR